MTASLRIRRTGKLGSADVAYYIAPWFNFVNNITPQERRRPIDERLADWNCRRVLDKSPGAIVAATEIEFDTEQDKIMFLLRWS